MLRFVSRVGFSLVFVALAGCSNGTSVGSPGSGGHGGTTGAGGAGHNPDQTGAAGTGGTDTSGSGGTGPGAAGSGGAGGVTGSGGTAGSSGGQGGSAGSGTTDGGAGQGGGADAGGDAGGDWIILFNGKDLSNWTSSVGQGQNAASSSLYAVDTLNGEPVIHVYPTQADQSTQPQATLRTKESYSRYIFHEEYMWGTKRFADRKQTDRDNGICFHINGTNQDIVWPQGLEFQIGSQPFPGDWIVGNIFTLANGASRFKWTYAMQNGQQVYSPNGTQTTVSGSYTRALTDKQRNVNPPMWNVLELTVHGATDATYTVNGEVANKLTNMEWNNGGTWMPLDHGPIALQAEFAEIYIRNVKIKILP